MTNLTAQAHPDAGSCRPSGSSAMQLGPRRPGSRRYRRRFAARRPPGGNPRTLPSMAYVLELGSAEELAEVGGKARNLGILLRAGFPVPPGFCVTSAGYRKAVGSRLTDLFAELVAAADDQTAQHRLAGLARELVATAPAPAELA